MRTRIDEISDGVYRISSHTTDAGKAGLLYNQYLIAAPFPLLFHTGQPYMFGAVRDAVAAVLDPSSIAYISAAHASRPDEFGCLPQWLALAPKAIAVHTAFGIAVVLKHQLGSDERLMPLRDNEQLDLGDRRITFLHTPHVPFREAAMLWEPSARILWCGDQFTVGGDWPPTTTEDLLAETIAFERRVDQVTVSAHLPPTLRKMAALKPLILAGMHAPAYTGDCPAMLERLAQFYEGGLARAVAGGGDDH